MLAVLFGFLVGPPRNSSLVHADVKNSFNVFTSWQPQGLAYHLDCCYHPNLAHPSLLHLFPLPVNQHLSLQQELPNHYLRGDIPFQFQIQGACLKTGLLHFLCLQGHTARCLAWKQDHNLVSPAVFLKCSMWIEKKLSNSIFPSIKDMLMLVFNNDIYGLWSANVVVC